MSANELLPCPFCGETPVVDCAENHSEHGGPDNWLVCCGTAYCYGNAFSLDNAFHSKAHACEAWNTRSAPAAVPGPLEGELLVEDLARAAYRYIKPNAYSRGLTWAKQTDEERNYWLNLGHALLAAMARTARPGQ